MAKKLCWRGPSVAVLPLPRTLFSSLRRSPTSNSHFPNLLDLLFPLHIVYLVSLQ